MSYKKQTNLTKPILRQKNYVNFGIKLDAEISIWMQSRFDGFYFSATLIATVLCRARSKRVIDGNTDIYILVWLLGRHFMCFLIIMWDHWLWLSNASSPRSQSPGPTVTIVGKGIKILFSSIVLQKRNIYYKNRYYRVTLRNICSVLVTTPILLRCAIIFFL